MSDEIGVMYARYSAGSKQTEQSIEGQRRECMTYAAANGITIIHEYIDRKISGKTDNREAFLQMIEDSKKRLFTVVVTYKTDRFSRSRYDAAVYKRILSKNGVRVVYARETIPDGPEGIVMEGLLEALAEYYSAEMRQKIVRGMIESARKCKALGTVIFGYQKAPDGRYEINEKQAAVVRLIFQSYCEGMTLKDIANLTFPLGLRTKSGHAVQEARITKIISNPKYIGIYEAYGIRVEGGMPAIIDKDTFFLAQKRLVYYQHHKGEQGGKAHAKADYLLSGKVFCGLCGEPMLGYSSHGRTHVYYYYICRNKRRYNTCSQTTIYKSWLEKKVEEQTRMFLSDHEILQRIVDGCLKLQRIRGKHTERKRQLKQAIRQTDQQIERMVTAIAEGIASESLKKRLEELEQQKALLTVQYNDLLKKPKITAQQLHFMFSQMKGGYGESEEIYRKRLLNTFVHSVFLYNDKIVITYNLTGDSPHQAFTTEVYSEFEPILKQFTDCQETHTLFCGASQQPVGEPEEGSLTGCFFVCKNLYIIGSLLVFVSSISID